jgi:methylenetetrahydrofolate dehydrogenase (NADP+)/methenyltetrahydrofolate cyclohydrolase
VLPCTLRGIVGLMEYYNIRYTGKKLAILGKGLTIGKPASLLLSRRGATVSSCDVKTVDLDQIISQADIILCATDQPDVIKPELLRRDTVVLDAGFKVAEDGKVHGNLNPGRMLSGGYTSVPGGIGVLTVLGAMDNTLDSYLKLQ